MTVYLLNSGQEVVRILRDDDDESFLHACEAGARGSTRRGVSRYGMTFLNPIQCEMLAEELRALPAAEWSTAIQDICAAADEAVQTRGFLRFAGQ